MDNPIDTPVPLVTQPTDTPVPLVTQPTDIPVTVPEDIPSKEQEQMRSVLKKMRKYHDIFGKPTKGIHEHRIFGFATVDLVGTLVIGGVLGLPGGPVGIVAGPIVLFGIGQVAHGMCGVNTKFINNVADVHFDE